MTLIALQAFVIVLITLPSDIYSAKFYKIQYYFLPFTDMVVQLMICYICYTQGSCVQLRKFDL